MLALEGIHPKLAHDRGSLLALSKESNLPLGRRLPLSLSLSPRSASPREKVAYFTSRVKPANPLADSRQIFLFAGPYVTNSHSTNK